MVRLHIQSRSELTSFDCLWLIAYKNPSLQKQSQGRDYQRVDQRCLHPLKIVIFHLSQRRQSPSSWQVRTSHFEDSSPLWRCDASHPWCRPETWQQGASQGLEVPLHQWGTGRAWPECQWTVLIQGQICSTPSEAASTTWHRRSSL